MQTLAPSFSAISAAATLLRQGGVVCHATETCYGFAASLLSEASVRRLFAVKGMPVEKPLSILVRSIDEAKRYGHFSARALRLADYFWPGPLTILVPRAKALPSFFNPGIEHIGMRISPHPVVRDILEQLCSPLVTTSANVFRQPEAYQSAEVLRQFHGRAAVPDFLLDSGILQRVLPSTILNGETLQVIREGSVMLEEIYKVDHGRNAGGHQKSGANHAKTNKDERRPVRNAK